MINNKYITKAFYCVFVIVLLHVKAEAGGIESVTLEVMYDNPVLINIKKYGVNGALLGSKMSYGNDKLIVAYKDIDLAFTRFPGGSIGNYYRWSAGDFSCNHEPDERSDKRIERMNKTLKRTGGTYSVDDFFHFVSATDTEFTYMLNILCESEENNSKLMQHMKNNNIDLKYIELGNEMYSKSYSWVYEDAESYIKGVEKNYAAIKNLYPDAKIGLVVSPISFAGNSNPEPNGKPSKSWPKKLRGYDILSANSMFSDALVIHIYGHPYNNKWLKSNPITFEEHFLTVMEHFNNKFDVSMQYLQKLGDNKPVWITEWGVTAPADKRKGLFREYKKSAFHALYVASVLSSITLDDRVEIANYHIIRDLWKSTKNGYEITDVGKVLSLFIDSAKSSDIAYKVDVNLKKTGLKVLMYTASKGEDLFIVNESSTKFVIDKLISKSNFFNYDVESMSIMNDVFKINNVTYKKNLDGSGVEIEPYSIMRISNISSKTIN